VLFKLCGCLEVLDAAGDWAALDLSPAFSDVAAALLKGNSIVTSGAIKSQAFKRVFFIAIELGQGQGRTATLGTRIALNLL